MGLDRDSRNWDVTLEAEDRRNEVVQVLHPNNQDIRSQENGNH
jgi:hypothetical protein